MDIDRSFIERAITLATESVRSGGGPFGAVITRDDKLVAESGNRVVLLKDPTAHAEVLAIREAAKALGTHKLTGCVLYASCEPCPMCLAAIYWSGIRRVVYSSDRNDAAAAGFDDRDIYGEICLDQAERSVSFRQVHVQGADEAFKLWNDMENKIIY